MTDKKLQEAVRAKEQDLQKIDEGLFGEAMGVGLAILDLRRALDVIDAKIGTREFEEAARLGYKDVASAFIFLQRALGGLNDTCLDKCGIVQDIAFELRMPYEDVEPSVDATLSSLQPKPKRPASTKKVKEAMKKGRDDLARSPKRKPKGRY